MYLAGEDVQEENRPVHGQGTGERVAVQQSLDFLAD